MERTVPFDFPPERPFVPFAFPYKCKQSLTITSATQTRTGVADRQCRVVRKPINANLWLKVNRGFHLALEKWFESLISS